jgi:hypothetical protein
MFSSKRTFTSPLDGEVQEVVVLVWERRDNDLLDVPDTCDRYEIGDAAVTDETLDRLDLQEVPETRERLEPREESDPDD